MKKHFFKTFEFEFEARRLLWYVANGGTDFAEVATVCERIQEKNYDSWYQEWFAFAEKLVAQGASFSTESRGNAFLRASRYYQAAEFFLAPEDERKILAYERSVDLFYRGLALKNIAFTQGQVPYEDVFLRSLLFKTEKQSQGTFYVCGGFDALLEELYFTSVVPALAEGYDVVLYEGPGQSNVLRKFHKTFEKNWGGVAAAVIHFAEENFAVVKPRIGVGISLGGLLVARGASSQPTLFNQIVLYNYFPAMQASFQKVFPKFLHRYLEQGFPSWLEKICTLYLQGQPFLNWQVTHAQWTFGANSLNQLIKIAGAFQEKRDLTTDCLIFVAKEENYYDYRLGQEFFAAIPASNKKIILFDGEEQASALHCQNGAAYAANDQIFSWLAEVRH